jgi:ABC-type antimicrobial peptide transport system ATPase subunit
VFFSFAAVVQEAIDGMIRGQRSLDGDPGKVLYSTAAIVETFLSGLTSTLLLLSLHSARSMTVVIVAHRLSTVRNSDVIYVVEEGRIIEHGSHDELVASDAGAYSALIRRQINAQNKLEKNESGL